MTTLTKYQIVANSEGGGDMYVVAQGINEQEMLDTFSKVDRTDAGDGDDWKGEIVLEKCTDTYEFIYADGDVEDYPVEEYYDQDWAYRVVEEGEWEEVQSIAFGDINEESDQLLADVIRHFGGLKYSNLEVNGRTVQLRIADHSENVKNIDRMGDADVYISVVIANKNYTDGRFLASKYERRANELEFNFTSDNSLQEIIEDVTYAIWNE